MQFSIKEIKYSKICNEVIQIKLWISTVYTAFEKVETATLSNPDVLPKFIIEHNATCVYHKLLLIFKLVLELTFGSYKL